VSTLGGGARHACARLADQRVDCWGSNLEGQLGDGTYDNSTVPKLVTDLQGAPISGVAKAGLSNGSSNHSCAIFDDGSLSCWGHNTEGQLGIGTVNVCPEEGVTHATPVRW
jgi:alpha-tubulin suppressor-like RCC1 family protein